MSSGSIVVNKTAYDYIRREEIQGTDLIKYVITEGTDASDGERSFPEVGDMCTMNYTGVLKSEDSKFDSSFDRSEPFEFQVGVGQVIGGWDQGVPTMKAGETAVLEFVAKLGYGEVGAGADIPPNSDLIFLVELISFHQKEKDIFDMTLEEKNALAAESRLKGGSAFKTGDLSGALRHYARGVEALETLDEENRNDPTCFVALCSNAAICHKKLGDYVSGARLAGKVLALEPKNTKALANKAQCHMASEDFKLAFMTLKDQLQDENLGETDKKLLSTVWKQIQSAERAYDVKRKALFGKMFKQK